MEALDFRVSRRGPAPPVSTGRLSPGQQHYLTGARQLARLMDARWGIGPLRFGLDSILGLAPGLGDAVAAVISLYQVWVGVQLGLPGSKLGRMLGNTIFDFLIGLVPFVGDLADTFFKVHIRNLRIIEQHVRDTERGSRGGRGR